MKIFFFILISLSFLIVPPPAVSAEQSSASASEKSDTSKRNTMIQILAESESEYAKGIDAYDLHQKKKSRKHFKKALKKLTSAKIDQNLFYGLSDYFERIYRELNNRLNLIETPNIPHSTILPIPIKSEHPMVQKYIQIFSRDPSRRSIIRAFERMGLYKDMIYPILKEYGLPEELVYLPIIESRYSISDVSHAGAVGLWQFMKHTGRGYDLRADYWIDERRDPERSTRAAARYLKNLYFWFNDWHLALAAYNRGEHGIGRDLSFSRTTDFSDLAERNAIPNETERYVPQFMAIVIISRDPLKYGIEFEHDEPISCDVYKTDAMIDLEIVARCAGTTLDVIRKLNPSLRAWCTPKNYPGFPLKLPYGTMDVFKDNIANVKNLCPAREFVRYRVKKGDILGKIAQKYKTSVKKLMRDNRIKNARLLMPGKVLIIKPGRKYHQ